MFDLINNLTTTAMDKFGDAASKRFFASLRERRFETTHCEGCGRTFFPPRLVCPHCASETVEWRELSGEGTVYAFTQQEKSLRFIKPEVVGIIELEENGKAVGWIMTKIAAPLEKVSIGARVTVDYIEISKKLVLAQFKIVDSSQ